MPDELPDPQKIWQEQPTEAIEMSLEEIRRKAHQFHARSRWKALMAIVIGIVLGGVFAAVSAKAQYLVLRIGWGILSLWGLYAAWKAYKWVWPSNLAEDAALSTSLEFYRNELERRRDYTRHIWRNSALWLCFVGLAFLVLPVLGMAVKNPRLLLNAIPFFVLLAAWFVAFVFLRRRDQRMLQREIDELEALPREGRS
jgi:hypothetical protein